ncbi:MAG TPA: dihydrofolate reductase family protein [Streptosporangiaceae bacterium]
MRVRVSGRVRLHGCQPASSQGVQAARRRRERSPDEDERTHGEEARIDDGCFAGRPGGASRQVRRRGWGLPPEDPDLKARKLDWLRDAGLHLMGRATYEEMARFWPVSDDEYAAPMNDIPKVVFSKTLTEADWAQSTIASGDLADEISALKREPGKDMIAWGGAAFAQSLSRLHLVDEYRLVVQPVALGDGLPLFAGLTAPFVLDLIEARAYADGAVLHVYRPAAE